MKRWRTLILLMLAVLNLAIIVLLIHAVIQQNKSTPPATAAFSSCSQAVLANIEPHLSPAVAWETDTLTVSATTFYNSPIPPDSSAQSLWEMLDSLRRALSLGCAPPATVTLIVHAHGQTQSTSHIAQITGADLAAWSNAELSDAELSLHSHYWHNSEIQTVPAQP
ncbi:MAG: hypothetical protein JW892_17225 [Anaerolineae bacterium]|nr:hypothetical protein [Anaerolineae bacterium]